MRYVAVQNLSREREIASRVGVADRWWLRLRGLLGRPPLAPGEGLLLVPCRGVHMVGMGYPIDVAFADETKRVVAVYHELQPGFGGRTKWHPEARYALELPAGTLGTGAHATMVGDRLDWIPSTSAPIRARPASLKEAVV